MGSAAPEPTTEPGTVTLLGEFTRPVGRAVFSDPPGGLGAVLFPDLFWLLTTCTGLLGAVTCSSKYTPAPTIAAANVAPITSGRFMSGLIDSILRAELPRQMKMRG